MTIIVKCFAAGEIGFVFPMYEILDLGPNRAMGFCYEKFLGGKGEGKQRRRRYGRYDSQPDADFLKQNGIISLENQHGGGKRKFKKGNCRSAQKQACQSLLIRIRGG